MTARTCEHCGGEIVRRDRDSDAQYATRRFCGRACYDAVTRIARPSATCEYCGETFGPSKHERPGQFVKRKPRFCSQACNGVAKSEAANRVIEIGRRCDHCGEQIVARSRSAATQAAGHRFCSRDCYLAACRAGRPSKTCPICSAEFGPRFGEARRAFTNRINCSRECSAEAQRRRHARAAPDCLACGEKITPGAGDTPARLARRKFCGITCRDSYRARQPRAERKPRPAARPRKAAQPAKPRRELSVFGDVAPAQTWRPAGFSAAPRIGRTAS